MKDYQLSLVVFVVLLAVFSWGNLSAASPLYSTTIPQQWVYQAHQSTPWLQVFYGQGDYDLLYFESLTPVPDQSVWNFAERTLALYGEPGGLSEFELEQSLASVEVDRLPGVACIYSYEDQPGVRIFEQRLFFLLPDKTAFTITLAGEAEWTEEKSMVLDEIISQWRWLF